MKLNGEIRRGFDEIGVTGLQEVHRALAALSFKQITDAGADAAELFRVYSLIEEYLQEQ